ncbi:MAG: hypothetical protein KKH04_07795 [Proteobacteria bacterium]|nr:hypothetical protein [Pseudomonadota bacterium]
MKGDKIPDQHHIARYCKPTHAPDGQIQATAFMLRLGEENLSINCLELLNCSGRENEVAQLQTIYATKLSVGARAKIAVLNVGEVRNHVLDESPDRRNLKVLHDPQSEDPSHSGIYNLREDDELIAELIL